jgi:hypothetical protein
MRVPRPPAPHLQSGAQLYINVSLFTMPVADRLHGSSSIPWERSLGGSSVPSGFGHHKPRATKRRELSVSSRPSAFPCQLARALMA